MPNSDWSDWLLRSIEEATPTGVAGWYLGCNGFVLKSSDGTTIFIDPYLGIGDPPRTVRMIPIPFDPEDVEDADAILATHSHTDHVHGPSQAPILASTNADFYGSDASIGVVDEEGWTDTWDCTVGQFHEVTEGDVIEIGEFSIAVESANDPDATHPVSYVIGHPAGTIFHGGDSKPSDDFEEIGRSYDIDLAILAFGSAGMIRDKRTREPTYTKWYNDENQIVDIASDLQSDRLLPSHWDMWRGLTADPTALHHHVSTFEYPRSLEIVEIGDRFDLG